MVIKLNSITCDTEIDSLIKENDVSGYLNELDDLVTTYVESYINTVGDEINNGGLSLNAYNLGDSSPLIESANSFMGNINLGSEFVAFKANVLSQLQDQRTKEINMLMTKVSEKITQLEQERYSINAQIVSISSILLLALLL